MDWQPQKPDGDPDFLDRLLAEARWAEPTPETVRRLRGHWCSLMARRTRRRRLAWLLMAASILLAAVGVTSWLHSGLKTTGPSPNDVAGKKVVPSSPHPPPVRAPKSPSDPMLVKKQPPARLPATRTSRPPNVYERVVLAAHRRVHKNENRLSRSNQVQPTVQTVVQTAEQPASDRQGSPLCRQLSLLLAKGDLQSVRAFLERVEDTRTSAEALDCLTSAQNPPVEALFRCLRGASAGQRAAAALALGRLNRPAVSGELIAMVARGTYRQEAMIALLSSSEATAKQFLADAQRNPTLSLTLWNAKRQFQNFLSWRS
jgi:hypothetical protein